MKILSKLILVFLLASCSQQSSGQFTSEQISGSWQGVLMELRLVFNISVDENDSFTATLDSPD
ncbi:MAG: hypothetical protein U9R60_14035, partial [Bacteroidota bacterium]|nr:hypothetical protein [Bacteroidota bacterium]